MYFYSIGFESNVHIPVIFSSSLFCYIFTLTISFVSVIDFSFKHLMGYYNYYDFFVSFFIPLALIVSLNTVTAFAVWKSSKVGQNVKTYNRYLFYIFVIYFYGMFSFIQIQMPFYWHVYVT